ncbi:10825_t:CDS:2 [Acaulospora morrowiae]|uniref:10825_t:CDS:1 n=1 Tax=Acaulospora morrowiae TaxID=94023 RepID=A0A9N9B9N5_9GLOM|nr:10825_t:CDS:2 [Acaulospora morrowiae]
MPYSSPDSKAAPTLQKQTAIPTGNSDYPAKMTIGISKKKQQDLGASSSLSHSISADDLNTISTEKTKPVEKKLEPNMPSKRDSERDNALKQFKDILSTSPQLSVSPRRKSAPDLFSRRPPLRVELPKTSDDLPCLLRKKSGEIVKSSLKKGKSEPTTPTFPKFVHFNAELEQIKLFDEAQRPQAISDVESDDDFDSTSDTDDEDEERTLVINIVNMPPMTTERFSKMLFVESIFLSNDKRKLQGRVQVQNIAFEKTVKIRYTFDSWQSVSEASAMYAEKVANRNLTNNFDVFIFAIDLIDNSRNSIDGKVLYFAVQYTVNGCVYWDNNGGQNYQSQSSFSSKWTALESCSPPSSNVAKPITKKSSRYDIGVSLYAAQNARRTISVSPVISYNHDSFRSFFPNSCIDGMPGTSESPIALASSWDDSKGMKSESLKTSTPIAIPTKPTVGSNTYYDLVNQYYFYQGSPYGVASPYASSPPVMT